MMGWLKAIAHIPAPPRVRVRNLALRLLGVVVSVAFASLYSQVLVLYGERGLLPAAAYLEGMRASASWFDMPTVFWLGCSDLVLRMAAAAGAAAGLVLAAGIAPRLCLVLAWVLYLSFATIGRDFLHFQWDNLLIESLFFALFVAPAGWRLANGAPPGRLGVFLMLWLVLRVHLESGAAKLLSGDPTWRDLTAMASYYETAPLPTWLAWYFHQLPLWVHQAASGYTLVVELLVPLLLWAGYRVRLVVFLVLATLQVGVILTANYTFFNYLTIVLCLFVLDDRHLPGRGADLAMPRSVAAGGLRRLAAAVVAIILMALSFVPFSRFVAPLPELDPVRRVLATFRCINAYHLFASMTLVRREAVIEGSDDGSEWREYEFHHKPGDPLRRPEFVAPHQPRVDFRMWFLLLGSHWGAPYFDTLLDRILHDPKAVAPLFAVDPFPVVPPRYLRVAVYRYWFTGWEEGRRTGAWWRRESQGYSRQRERF